MKVLSIKQMIRLKELGVDVKPTGECLMYTSDSSDNYYLKYGESTCEDDIKAFSLQDITELLTDDVQKAIVFINNEEYFVKCYEIKYDEENVFKIIYFDNIKQLLNACCEMLIWVTENGYLTSK